MIVLLEFFFSLFVFSHNLQTPGITPTKNAVLYAPMQEGGINPRCKKVIANALSCSRVSVQQNVLTTCPSRREDRRQYRYNQQKKLHTSRRREVGHGDDTMIKNHGTLHARDHQTDRTRSKGSRHLWIMRSISCKTLDECLQHLASITLLIGIYIVELCLKPLFQIVQSFIPLLEQLHHLLPRTRIFRH